MARAKIPVRDWELSHRGASVIGRTGKTEDRRRPVTERSSVVRALMRLPDKKSRKRYLRRIGVASTAMNSLLHRVEGSLSHTDAIAIRKQQVRDSGIRVKRKVKVVA